MGTKLKIFLLTCAVSGSVNAAGLGNLFSSLSPTKPAPVAKPQPPHQSPVNPANTSTITRQATQPKPPAQPPVTPKPVTQPAVVPTTPPTSSSSMANTSPTSSSNSSCGPTSTGCKK